jgi:uncharacterized membrane protein YfcA
MHWPFIMGTLAAAGFVQGLTGFGFGMVSIALLPLVLGVRQAAAISTVYTLLVTVITFLRNRGEYNWRLGFPFFISSCLGVPIGVYFLAQINSSVLLRVLGLVMVALASSELFFRGRIKPTATAAAVPFGVFSGSLSGAFNLGGVPTAAYAYANGWSRGQILAFLQVVLISSCGLRILFYRRAGFYEDFSWKFAAFATVPICLTLWFGHFLMQRIHPKHMRQGIFTFIGLFGLYYLFIH